MRPSEARALRDADLVLWSGAIARRLSDLDPENAPIYLRN
jgi:hypothetical protein